MTNKTYLLGKYYIAELFIYFYELELAVVFLLCEVRI